MSARKPPLPGPPPTMICPACSRRWDHLANPSCPVCGGKGSLTLGPLTRRYTPGTVSHAVTYALELCASIDMRARKDDYVTWLSRARHNLTVTVNRCIKAGLLARQETADATPGTLPAPSSPTDVDLPTAAALGVRVTGYSDSPEIAHRLSAGPVPFTIQAVPVDGAAPTGFSNGGSIANFAIVADPIRPLDRETENRRDQERVGKLLGRSMFPDPE